MDDKDIAQRLQALEEENRRLRRAAGIKPLETTVYTNVDKRSIAAVIQKIYDLDKIETKQELFDWIFQRVNELLTNNDFERCDEIFSLVDVNRISASTVTALLRSTFMASPRLPLRTQFLSNATVLEKLARERGAAGAKKMLKQLR